jgi:hypothetical protein
MNYKQIFSHYLRQNGLEILPDETNPILDAMVEALIPAMKAGGVPVPEDDDEEELNEFKRLAREKVAELFG